MWSWVRAMLGESMVLRTDNELLGLPEDSIGLKDVIAEVMKGEEV